MLEGHSPDLIYGEFLPREFAAKLITPVLVRSANTRKPGGIPADLSALGDGAFAQRPIVSEAFRAAIEALEPGRHQFIPVGFVNGDIDPPEPIWTGTNWYYFNLLNWVEPDRFFNVEMMLT